MEHQTLEGRIAALSGEVQDLREILNKAIQHLPVPGNRHTTSAKFAQELGISKRCLIRWCETGQMDPSCFVKKKRGTRFQYVFDRQRATVCAEQIQRGER
ncbi:hypothetical protein SynBIOSE41_02706 [Synechococcus sp. BIOS-E4-1]|uniref:hypothetical protein n=1 Tax=Synechococcus sp. BIOS-E4-1 TaxID=1400864 RepID=UPI0016478172|nr:hypothetical protein [Synechococcus sp. BIOS-E4-1]QNI55197.1 hypothetical protein SynBIOSE41_02706 [Synechococcus sp. BIOS-E4-1]